MLIQAAKDAMQATGQMAAEKPLLASLAAIAVSITAITTACAAVGIDPTPWADPNDVKTVREECLQFKAEMLPLQRAHWEGELEKAEADLAVNPNSRTAKTLKRQATGALARIDRAETAIASGRTRERRRDDR